MRSDDDLDALIEHVTVDAYDDEGYDAFLQAFEDEIEFPFPATLAGMPISVVRVDYDGNERRGLVAAINRDGHTATVSLLDLEIPADEQPPAHLVAAYRRRLGIT